MNGAKKPMEWLESSLKKGYFEQNSLRLELVQRETMEPLVAEIAGQNPPLTTTQLRRFFSHCRALDTTLRGKTSVWEQVRVDFVRLDYFAEEAFKKGKIPLAFADFIRWNVKAVQSEADFQEGFMKHFEALVGFGASYFRDERRA